MKKPLFIILLLGLIASASFWMILESSLYYNSFYQESWKGFYLAELLELFAITLAVIKIGNLPLRILAKSIMCAIFAVIIFAAGMQAINPTLQSMAKSNQKKDLVHVLQEEVKTLKVDFTVFSGSLQKTNTAITANERRKMVAELVGVLKSDVSSNSGNVALANIILLLSIRFLIQLANLCCAGMVGNYYRTARVIPKEKKKAAKSFCQCGCGMHVKDGRRYILGHNLVPGKKKPKLIIRKNRSQPILN